MYGDALAEIDFLGSYQNSPPLKADPGTLAPGSRNFLCFGQEHLKPFLGLTSVGNGARSLFPVLNGYGGLGDSGGNGLGSLFSHISRTLGYIGNGQVSLNGTNIAGATASSTLKILLSRSGSYTAGDSGPYAAGLGQPSAPIVAVLDAPGVGFTGLLEGPTSFKIARLRSSTGARSIASMTSSVVTCTKQTVRLTFPAAATGQDFWVVFAPQQGFGGIGPHYRLALSAANGALQISEAAVAASTVDGVGRSIEIEYQTGDLSAEFAWIDDYPPPAGTHAFAIENVWAVGGCYSDATTAPSSTSPGTCIAVSLQNAPESYRPTDLLYLPEQIVSVLNRPSDSWVYIGCRNSVHAVQFTGAQDGPALSIMTLWPDVGIAAPHNWCQVDGILFAFTAKAGAVTIGALGRPDRSFARAVREDMKSWEPATTIVGHDPDTQSVVFANGTRSHAFHLPSQTWSTKIILSDFQTGTALSCVTSQQQLKITLDNAGTHTLYTWNVGAGSSPSAFSQWDARPSPLPKTIRGVIESVHSDNTNPVYVSIHKNLRKVAVEDAAMTIGSNVVTSPTAAFTADDVGKFVLVSGAGAGGTPLRGRIKTFTNSTTVEIVIPTGPFSSAGPQNAIAAVTGKFCVIGSYIYSRTPRSLSTTGRPKRPRVRECLEYCVGIHMRDQTADAQPLKAFLFGSVVDGSAVQAAR